MSQGNNQKKAANKAAVPEKDWKEESDSPIEQAKIHPTIKRTIDMLQWFNIIIWVVFMLYIKGVWDHSGNTELDAFIFVSPPLSALATLILISMARVAKTRE